MLPSGRYDEIIDHFNDCAKCSIDAIFFHFFVRIFLFFPNFVCAQTPLIRI